MARISYLHRPFAQIDSASLASNEPSSESKSLEDEVSHGLSLASTLRVAEPLFKLSFQGLAGFLASLRGIESLLSHDVFEIKVILDGETSGEQVSVVDELDEGLDLGLAVKLLLRHPLVDLLGGALNASNEGVAELSVLLALIDLLYDDRLLARAPSCEEDDDATSLHTNIHEPKCQLHLMSVTRHALSKHPARRDLAAYVEMLVSTMIGPRAVSSK